MTSTIICFFTLKFWIGTSRKGDEDRDWKHSTSSCRQKPLSRLIFKRRTDAANRELDVNQRWLTGQGHFRGQSDFNRGRCPSGPTPRSAPGLQVVYKAFDWTKCCVVQDESFIFSQKRKTLTFGYMCYGANKTWDVQIHLQALFKGVVTKQARFIQWQTGTTQARQRVILGQAWVDDRWTISNRGRQRVNPGNTGRYQTRENRQGKTITT